MITARAQSGFEFVFFLILGLVVMGLLLLIIGRLSHNHSEAERNAAMMELGRQLQDELVLAATVHDGYTRHVTLPERQGRFPYQITTGGTLFTITSEGFHQSFRMPEATGSFVIGDNTIRVVGGEILIN